MIYDYSKLVGRIKDVYGNQENFAIDMKVSCHTISKKLNGKVPFKQTEITRASKLLKIERKLIHLYFFEEKVSICKLSKEPA